MIAFARLVVLIGVSLCVLVIPVQSASAIYNANMTGKITGVFVYTDSDSIYFTLDNQPASHPVCNPQYFVLDPSLPAARLDRLYSRALTAKTTGESINIGYDATTECTDGYIKVHRIG